MRSRFYQLGPGWHVINFNKRESNGRIKLSAVLRPQPLPGSETKTYYNPYLLHLFDYRAFAWLSGAWNKEQN
jgi:hypothetical protein